MFIVVNPNESGMILNYVITGVTSGFAYTLAGVNSIIIEFTIDMV